jgi:hypothetical protein
MLIGRQGIYLGGLTVLADSMPGKHRSSLIRNKIKEARLTLFSEFNT